MESQRVSLATLGGGRAIEAVDVELERIFSNIIDPNTEAEKSRKVTLTIEVKPNEERTQAIVIYQAKSSLAPDKAHATMFYLGMSADGAVAHEVNPKQLGLPLTTRIDSDEVVDDETGEVIPIQKGGSK
jgi:hypothetical protein